MLKIITAIFLALLLMNTQFAHADNKKTNNITFGVYQSDKPSIMLMKFHPVLKHLESRISTYMGSPVKVSLKIFNTYENAQTALVNGEVDFVRFGPASYIYAKEQNPGIQLLAMENRKNSKHFNGVIAVAENSPIRSLSELQGKTFAFGNKNSTIGHYLVQAELVKHGIFSSELNQHEFLSRHDTVFKAIALGDFDAGALKETTFNRYNKAGLLRVIHTFKNITKPWIARSGLTPSLFKAIQQSLLTLDNKKILKELKVTGFYPTTNQDYDFVRQQMKTELDFDDK